MQNAVILKMLTVGILSLSTVQIASAEFSGGQGSESDPFLVKTAADLGALSEKVLAGDNCQNVYFRLENDIDMSGVVFSPIGESFKEFAGVFDGNGYSIHNLEIASADGDYGVGLFGATGESAVIRNLSVGGNTEISSSGQVNYIAVLVGQNKGTIENCTVSGNVTGYRYVGGVTGTNAGGDISDCVFEGTIDGQWFVGGVAGYLDYDGTVVGCSNHGTVQGVKHVGGIVGQANGNSTQTPRVALCYNAGQVTMTNGADGSYETMAAVGGIVGFSYLAVVEQCFNKALVQSDNYEPYVGGIVGNNMDATVSDCYNTWNVTGTNGCYSGGIVGINKGENSVIRNCYNTARAFSDLFAGEICPADANLGTVENCYFDKQTGAPESEEGVAVLTRELASATPLAGFDAGKWVFTADLYPMIKGLENTVEARLMASPVICYAAEDGSVYDRADFVTNNFKVGAADGVVWSSSDDAVKIEGNNVTVTRSLEGDTEVTLTAVIGEIGKQIPMVVIADMKGTGTAEDPFLIENANQFRYFATSVSGGNSYAGQHLKLTTDIDLGGKANPYEPAGNSSGYFDGHFDGNGMTVTGVYVNRPDDMYIGLFSRISETGIVENLTVGVDSYFCGMGNVGAIAGRSAGIVRNCGNHGTVTGLMTVGGIVGNTDWASTPGVLANCFNTGEVSATRGVVGGIVGNAGYIDKLTHCFNSGKVTDLATGNNPGQAGGIVGYATVPVEYCYNTGYVTDLADDEEKSIAGGIVGRTYGSESIPVQVSYCYNAGKVVTATGKKCGPIIGFSEYEGDGASDCYFDAQVMPGVEDAEGVVGLPTASMVDAEAVSALGTEEWAYSGVAYPVLKAFENTDAANLASAAVFLSAEDDYDHVASDFTLSVAGGIQWYTGKTNTLNIDNDQVVVNRQEEDVVCPIYAYIGEMWKELVITVLKKDPSGVDELASEGVAVYARDGRICISGAEGASVSVYNATGKLVVAADRIPEQASVAVDTNGVLIVKIVKGTTVSARKVVL